MKFVIDAINRYIPVIEDKRYSPLPQVLVENMQGVRSVVVVATGPEYRSRTAEEHLAAGRQLLEQMRGQSDVIRRAALAFNAYVVSDEEKVSAIAVEFLEGSVNHTFAQRYIAGKRGKIHLIGEPLYQGSARSS